MKITEYSKVFFCMLMGLTAIMSCVRTTVAIKGEVLTVSHFSWWVKKGDVEKVAFSEVKSIRLDKRKNERMRVRSPDFFWHIVCVLENGKEIDVVKNGIGNEKPAQKIKGSMEKGIAQNSLRLSYFHLFRNFFPIFCMILLILFWEILHVCFTGRSLEDNKKKWDAQKS